MTEQGRKWFQVTVRMVIETPVLIEAETAEEARAIALDPEKTDFYEIAESLPENERSREVIKVERS